MSFGEGTGIEFDGTDAPIATGSIATGSTSGSGSGAGWGALGAGLAGRSGVWSFT